MWAADSPQYRREGTRGQAASASLPLPALSRGEVEAVAPAKASGEGQGTTLVQQESYRVSEHNTVSSIPARELNVVSGTVPRPSPGWHLRCHPTSPRARRGER